MPISIDDLRKTTSYSRKDKRRSVAPILLKTTEDLGLAQDFCDYFSEVVSAKLTQADFSEQYLIERAGGDFKLARGLISTLMRVYVWECDSFEERVSKEDWLRLQKLGFGTSSELRLALYDYINEANSGFVGMEGRAESLELFGAGLGLAPIRVEELLFLDNEQNARLKLRVRKDGQPFYVPSAADVVRDYNKLAVETLLFYSSEIIFSFTALPGALLKRIGFLSKIYRIPYDLDFNTSGEVQLRLYGPAEAFGSASKYGESLTELTFKVLRMAQSITEENFDTGEDAVSYSGPKTTLLIPPTAAGNTAVLNDSRIKTGEKKGKKTKSLFLSGIEATINLKGKIFYLNLLEVMPALVAKRTTATKSSQITRNEEVKSSNTKESFDREEVSASFEYPNAVNISGVANVAEAQTVYSVEEPDKFTRREESEDIFDSSVEAQFYKQWAALEREGQSAGWHLVREPEAIVIPNENLIFVPDFMLVRGKHQVFLEIIGFWTPAYRARKLEKLEKLKQHGTYKLLLAAANELKADFQQGLYPIIFYKNFLKPTDIVGLLQKEYTDFDERLAEALTSRIKFVEQLEVKHYIAENELYQNLKCYNKNELLETIKRLDLDKYYVEGYGLCNSGYLEQLGTVLKSKLILDDRATSKFTFDQAVLALEQSSVAFDSTRVEALLERLPGFKIDRLSLFEVFLTIA